MQVAYHEKAASDLNDIWSYVEANRGSRVADDVIDRIHDTLSAVGASQPRSGRRRPEFGENVRSFPSIPYVVFYQALGKRVTVLRILHGHRDLRQPLMSLLTAS